MSADELMPSVSVVICTRNRADSIAQSVRSVLANGYPNFDVTVIDQSTAPSTRMIVSPLAATDARLHYVGMQSAGLSRAYNLGVRSSSGEILAFTDDDCVVPQDWLTSIVHAFARDSDADLLYGQVLAPGSAYHVPGITPALAIAKPERLSRHDGFKVFGMGANFAARRRLLHTLGGFDEVLGGGAPLRSSQDYDLAYRTYCAGSIILLRPEVWVMHYGTRQPYEWPNTLRAYGIGDGGFYWKHVRCRDVKALWLLTRQFTSTGVRAVAKGILRRQSIDLTYVRGMLAGIRASSAFAVDCRSRLYVSR